MIEPATTATDSRLKEHVTITHVIYGMYAASLLVGITALVGIVLNYIKRAEVAGTYLESHFRWQIRTFWYGLLWGVIGVITLIIMIGMIILFVDLIWFIYRIAKGWLRLNEGKAMYV